MNISQSETVQSLYILLISFAGFKITENLARQDECSAQSLSPAALSSFSSGRAIEMSSTVTWWKKICNTRKCVKYPSIFNTDKSKVLSLVHVTEKQLHVLCPPNRSWCSEGSDIPAKDILKASDFIHAPEIKFF
jgi:hypothetical protein